MTPLRVRVRMYQVGFGDCFLVTIEYDETTTNGRAERHILFDLGSTSGPRTGPVPIGDVAELVAEHTNGKLDVVVVSHRHRDHILGFGDDDGAKTLLGLDPELVLRPWTEDPALPADAAGPADEAVASPRTFVDQVAVAQSAVERLAAATGSHRGALRDLRVEAAEQLPNKEAIATLDKLARAGRGRYLHAGKSLRLASVVPGLRISVLGPPTVAQDPRVAHRASRNAEYWMMQLQRSLTAAAPAAGVATHSGQPAAPVQDGPAVQDSAVQDGPVQDGPAPGQVRWLVEHLTKHRTQSMIRLVRALDSAMNNTSLVLLLEVGNLKLLFPGDAQIENWQFTLDKLGKDAKLRDKLASIDLYKVGHHGSRNATPRSLHALWADRPAGAPELTALMSTKSGVHGDRPQTAVPRETLVEALKEVATLHSTDDLPADTPFVEVVADATGGPFRLVTG